MADEDRTELNRPDESSSKDISIEYRPTGRGDARLFIDGGDSGERVAIPEHMRPTPPEGAVDADELSAIRTRNEELEARFEQAEPFIRISSDPIMREILQERIDRGEIELPRSAPPAPEDVIGHRKRMAEPESESILASMRDYAASLPSYQAEELASNHRVWCQAYDRFKAAGAGSLPRPATPAAYPQVPMDRRSLEAILKSKEVSNARVEIPGGVPDYPEDSGTTGQREYQKARGRLRAAYAGGGTAVDRDAAEIALVQAHENKFKPRRSSDDHHGY